MLLFLNLSQIKKRKLQSKLSSSDMNQLFFYNSNDKIEDICQKIKILQIIAQFMSHSNTELVFPKRNGFKKVHFNFIPEILAKK